MSRALFTFSSRVTLSNFLTSSGKDKFSATGVLSPLKIHNHPDDPYISGDSDLDKIERLRKIVRVVGDIRDKWVIT